MTLSAIAREFSGMQEERPTGPNSGDVFRDPEVEFDLIAYLGDHPFMVGVVIVALLIFFFWYMRRRNR